jgi:hypothetical protein
MRDRCWRRYIKELKTTRRLKLKVNHGFYWYIDANSTCIKNTRWSKSAIIKDLLGTRDEKRSKEISTEKSDSKYSDKYSPNRGHGYGCSPRKDIKTRLYNKRFLLKILEEHGIKHFNTEL